MDRKTRDRKLARHRSEKSLGDTRYTGKLKGTLNRAQRRYWKLFINITQGEIRKCSATDTT